MLKDHPSLINGEIKINFGSGGVEIPGFISVDKFDDRAAIKLDVFEFDLLPPETVKEIAMIHCLEHISPYRVTELLTKFYNLLEKGGKLSLEVPDIEELFKKFEDASKEDRYGILNCVYGSVNTTNDGDPSNITASHLWGWYPEMLQDHLIWAGFDANNVKFLPEHFPHPLYNFRCEAIKC